MSDRQRRAWLPAALLRAVGVSILETLRFKNAEINVLLVGDREMIKYNKRYKRSKSATDVLAFSQLEGGKFPDLGRIWLGDIVISVDTAARQAPQYGNSLEKELCLYMVHGVLHLLGYDDIALSARRRMRKKEREVMEVIERKFFGGERYYGHS